MKSYNLNKENLKIILICSFSFLLSACNKPVKHIQGYVDADYTYISSNYSGILSHLNVSRGDEVTKNQLLFKLDDQPQISQVKNAQAKLNRTTIEIKQKQIEFAYAANLYKHYQQLIRFGGISREEFNSAKNNYLKAEIDLRIANTDLENAEANAEKAKWSMSSKTVKSPLNGYVCDTYYTPGELIAAQKPVLSLLAKENLKLTFYVEEPILAKLHLKQQIQVTCDSCHGSIPAWISYISANTEYTPPYIYSDNTRAKFIYHIEAKFTEQTNDLHPGQPVSINLGV